MTAGVLATSQPALTLPTTGTVRMNVLAPPGAVALLDSNSVAAVGITIISADRTACTPLTLTRR